LKEANDGLLRSICSEVTDYSFLDARDLSYSNAKSETVYPLAVAVSTGNIRLCQIVIKKLSNIVMNQGYELFTADPEGDIKLKLSPL
jgi:hypothetical protein